MFLIYEKLDKIENYQKKLIRNDFLSLSIIFPPFYKGTICDKFHYFSITIMTLRKLDMTFSIYY